MKKVVLAYSGGLDTSFCVKYLTKELGYEVYTALANTGGFSADEIKCKQRIIEEICAETAEYLRKNGFSHSKSEFLEPHAYEIQNKIKNPEIRLLHIMEGGTP